MKASGVLSGNTRTIAAFVSILAGSPLWFFLFELTSLNLAVVIIAVMRRRTNLALASRLEAMPQAAAAPN